MNFQKRKNVSESKVQMYNRIMEAVGRHVKKSLLEMAAGSLFAQYDDVDMFSERYYIVMKDGKYNLMDRNGKLISEKWFEEIRKSDDGKTVTMKSDNGNAIKVNAGMDDEMFRDFANTISIADIFDRIEDSMKGCEIESIEPFMQRVPGKASVEIIAIVRYNGKEYMLGKDGQLYEKGQDGNVRKFDPEEVGKKETTTNNKRTVAKEDDFTDEQDIWFRDNDFFEDGRAHFFDFECHDGYAVGTPCSMEKEDNHDSPYKEMIMVEYPLKKDVLADEKLTDEVIG